MINTKQNEDVSPSNPPSASSANLPESQFPNPTLTRRPSTSDSSIHSREEAPHAASALAINTADIDMDPTTGSSGHRRRRSSLRNSIDTTNKLPSRRRSPQSAASDGRNGLSKRIPEEPKLGKDGNDDDLSESEDFEMDNLSDDGLQDDEETGLTGRDRRKRKKRKQRNTLLDQRVTGEVNMTEEEKKEADKYVVKNMLINGVFIVLWYIFSLSISIVSPRILGASVCQLLIYFSIINGCFRPITSIFTSLYSLLADICLYNSPWQGWSSLYYLSSDHDTIRFPILIILMRQTQI